MHLSHGATIKDCVTSEMINNTWPESNQLKQQDQ